MPPNDDSNKDGPPAGAENKGARNGTIGRIQPIKVPTAQAKPGAAPKGSSPPQLPVPDPPAPHTTEQPDPTGPTPARPMPDGAISDSPMPDGPRPDEPALDGPMPDGPAADEPAAGVDADGGSTAAPETADPSPRKAQVPVAPAQVPATASDGAVALTSAGKAGLPAKAGIHEREFLPAALEILETPANPIGRAIALSLAAFFIIAVAWAMIGEIDIVAVAQGKIVPTGGVKLIQPLETGTVRAIHVRDGQEVKAGDVLVELDPTESEVDKDQMIRERVEAAVEMARLETFIAELGGSELPFAPPPGAPPALVSMNNRRLDSDILAFDAQMDALDADLARREAERAGVFAELHKLRQTLPLIEEREQALKTLLDKGVTPKPQWLEVRTLLIETQQDILIQNQRINEIAASVQAARKEMNRLRADTERQAYADLLEAQKTFEQTDLALRKALKREAQHRLTAPVDGTVQQLNVHTVGGVVTPAEPLMVLVPKNVPLEIRAQVLNKDIGFVRNDQEVEIKLDAFPFTKYGTIDGRVVDLSRDAIDNEDLGPVYDTRVSMAETVIEANGEIVPLTPGMSVSVEVKTGKRKIIEFLLSPILRYQAESIRER